MEHRNRRSFRCGGPIAGGFLGIVMTLLLAGSAANAATTFSLPFSEDFEGRPLGTDTTWICPASSSCTLSLSNAGSANERKVVSDAYQGTRAFQFVVNTIDDPGAYRTEGQSHPNSDDLFKGDTIWIGYAIKVPADLPTDPHLMRTHQIKHLDPQCQVSLGFEDDEWQFLEEYTNCGGDVDASRTGVPLRKGSWQTIVVKHVLTNDGSFSVWIDNGNASAPNLTLSTREVFPVAPTGSPCYFKVGLYEGWWRVHPEMIIPDRWTATYDNLRVCREGSPGCGFSFVYPGGAAMCGDGSCDADESCSSCEADCGACRCGNDTCDPGEQCSSCEADCGACTCGNETCDPGEGCSSCEADCGACACGNGTCDPGESCNSCAEDCGGACLELRAAACHVDTPHLSDGVVDEWAEVPPVAISHTRSIASEPEACATDADCSAALKTAWDVENLYVLIEVTDDVAIDDSVLLFQDDGVELYLDGGNEKAASYDSNDFQLAVTRGDEASPAMEAATGFTHASAATARGYLIEYTVPWSALGVTPMGGTVVGFDVAINDDDDGGDTRETQLVWNGNGEGWRDPRQLGEVALSAAPCRPMVDVCGDGTCHADENAMSCPEDCPSPSCGDGSCQSAESCASCEADCGACPVSGGDGGPTNSDAGSTENDAGSGDGDARSSPPPAGCSCRGERSAPPSLSAWLVFVAGLVMIRRRRF